MSTPVPTLKDLMPGYAPKQLNKRPVSKAQEMMRRYPDRVAVFVKRSKTCKHGRVPEVDKNKYLSPRNISVIEMLSTVRKRMSLPSEVSIFFMVHLPNGGSIMLPSNMLMGEAHDIYAGHDGFMRIDYMGENTFG